MIEPDKIVYSRRRTFGLEIDESGLLIVRAPHNSKKSEIIDILRDKKDWIQKKQTEVLEKQPIEYDFIEGEEFYFLGKKYPLQLIDSGMEFLTFDGEKFLLDSSGQKEARKHFINWYKDKTIKIAGFLADKYSKDLGKPYNELKISNAKTRWGSCNNRNNISISWRLALAPLQVLDYVVAHEVAHLKYLDHSRKFWNTVEYLTPKYKIYRKWLKDNSHLLKF